MVIVAVSILALFAGWPDGDIPEGDITGAMHLEPVNPQVGTPARLIIRMHNHLPGTRVPPRPGLPPEYAEGPWYIEIAEENEGTYTWIIVFLEPGQFTLPDIPISYRPPGKPLRPATAMLRFIDGVSGVATTRADMEAMNPPMPHPLVRILALAWLAAPAGWLVWRLHLWLTWPGTREGLRCWLETNGLPPGRHLPDQISAFWQSKGWPMKELERALSGMGPWPDPRPWNSLSTWFWIIWLTAGAL